MESAFFPGGFLPLWFLLAKLQSLLLDHGFDLFRSIWNKCALVTDVSRKSPTLKSQWQNFLSTGKENVSVAVVEESDE